MIMRPFLCFLFVLLIPLSLAAAAPGYSSEAGLFAIGTLLETWRDETRSRDVPVKIYFPKAAQENATVPCPVIIFSHGLGGSRDGYGYLGEHWAGCGYISVHLQHAGSDKTLLRGLRPLKKLREAAADPANAINRPKDVVFAIDRLTALNGDTAWPLHGRLDLSRLGVAGHSFGAFTTMAIAGAQLPVLGHDSGYPDRRVKAAIAMSTPDFPNNDTDAAFDLVTIPVFHLTGTEDGSRTGRRSGDPDPVIGNTTVAERLRPFRHTHHAPAYLLVFEGGDHLVFSGRSNGVRATDDAFQSRILAGSTAFWDAWLKEDHEAKHWLEDGGFSASLGNLGTFELNRR